MNVPVSRRSFARFHSQASPLSNAIFRSLALLVLLFPTLLSAQQQAKLTASLDHEYVVANEVTLLKLTLEGASFHGSPTIPQAPPLNIKHHGRQTSIVNSRRSQSHTYRVYCYRTGIFEIPPFKVKTRNGVIESEPLTLHVVDEKQLSEQVVEIGRSQLTYYSGIFLSKDKPYVGEDQPVVLKLYIDSRIRTGADHLPTIESKNLAAWRFELKQGAAGYEKNGVSYTPLSYHSTVSALKAGPAVLGPGKVDMGAQVRTSRRGIFPWSNVDLTFTFPKIDLEVRPLPTPAPTGFQGAVGDFQVTALPSAQSLELGENLTAELSITGTGNLNQLSPPSLQGSNTQWKSFDAVRVAQGKERRSSTGTTRFTQVLRPLTLVKELPPYELVFFDPVIEEYRTARSAPYPLIVTGALSADSSNGTPLLPLASGTMKSYTPSPLWPWQLIPAALVLAAFAYRGTLFAQGRKMASLPAQEFSDELEELRKTASKNRPSFFRALGRFLDRWPHEEIKDDANKWLSTRDDICFSPSQEEETILPKERKKIIDTLKRISPLILALCIFSPQQSEASLETHWKANEFQKGADLLRKQIAEKPSPSAYYNLGLFEEKLDRPGSAALCYYRALASDDSLSIEPVLNLATRTGALTRKDRDDKDWLARFPRAIYQELFFAGIWLALLAVAAKIALPTPKLRKNLILLFSILSPIALICGSLAWWYYPEERTYRPLIEASVVMSPQPLRQTPHSEGESFRQVPSGSLGYVTAVRGKWSFIEFARGLDGWIPNSSVIPVSGNQL